MNNIPKKVSERLIKQTGRFQRVLRKASDSDVNEADTVIIVSDMLSDVFGFNKYTEVTREYAIRNTYCDLAVKVDDGVVPAGLFASALTRCLKDNELES